MLPNVSIYRSISDFQDFFDVKISIYVDLKEHDFFYRLFKVCSANAITLYSAIVNEFEKIIIDKKKFNRVPYAADGANNMTGKNHSVAAPFKQTNP